MAGPLSAPIHFGKSTGNDALTDDERAVIARELRSIITVMSRVEEKVYILWQRTAAADGSRSAVGCRGRGPGSRAARFAVIHDRDIEAFRSAADHGVVNLNITTNGAGSALVNIDGKKFILPPTLALLLEILADENGSIVGDDPLVPWKRVDDVLSRLGHKTDRPRGRHHLNQNIHRLRKHLQRANVSPLFVQRASNGRIRFARRRPHRTPGS